MSGKAQKLETFLARKQFERIEARYVHAVFSATNNFDPATCSNCSLQCLECDHVVPLRRCAGARCLSEHYVPGIGRGGAKGIFCMECGAGFTSWTCPSCGAQNPVPQTIGEGGKCLIATAALGGPNAPELQELRGLREQVLKRTRWGAAFFERFDEHYYSFSPDVARRMALDPEMRETLEWSLVTPILSFYRWATARPSLTTEELSAVDGPAGEFLRSVWADLDAWSARVEIPAQFDDVPPETAAIEIGLMLRLAPGGAAARDALLERLDGSVLPLSVDTAERNEIASILEGIGISTDEQARILGPENDSPPPR